MKVLNLSILVFSFQLVTSLGFAGPSTSGGGFAVVCRDQSRNILSAELLDLYEARTAHGFQLMHSSGTELRDLIRAYNNGSRLMGLPTPLLSEAQLSETMKRFESHVQWLAQDEKLPNLQDLGRTITPPTGCQIEPLAVYYDQAEIPMIDLPDSTEFVVINQEIWNSLGTLSRAGLVMHEMHYRFYRALHSNPDTDSMDVRRMTASTFALNLIPAYAGIPTNSPELDSVYESENTIYHIISGASADSSLVRIQFTLLAGRPVLSKTFVDLPRHANLDLVYTIQSQQFSDWTATVEDDETRPGGFVKLVIRKGSAIVTELHL
jgi:hypothetical protein